MKEKEKLAMEAYTNGCNCAQAVFSAFADEMDLTPEQARRLMEAFGGGVGGLQEVCGAFSGASAVIGYLNSDGSKNAQTKKDTYGRIQESAKQFEDKFGSLRCYDILHGSKPVHLACEDIVKEGVAIVESYLQDNDGTI